MEDIISSTSSRSATFVRRSLADGAGPEEPERVASESDMARVRTEALKGNETSAAPSTGEG